MAAPTRDKRKSFRCPVDQSQQTGMLKVGRRRQQVMIINQSAGGYGVISDRDLRLAVGDVLALTVGGARFDVRVAHVGQTGTIDSTGEAKLAYRLGLQRVKEGDELPEDWEAGRSNWRSLLPSGGTLIVIVVLVATAALGILAAKDSPLLRQAFRRRPRPQPQVAVIAESISPTAEHVAERLTAKSARAPIPDVPEVPRETPAEPKRGTTIAIPTAASLPRRAEIADVDVAKMLVQPELVAELNLTAAQQREMRRILDEQSAALEELERTAQASGTAERAAQRAAILEHARLEALKTLTPEQLLLWQQRAVNSGQGASQEPQPSTPR